LLQKKRSQNEGNICLPGNVFNFPIEANCQVTGEAEGESPLPVSYIGSTAQLSSSCGTISPISR